MKKLTILNRSKFSGWNEDVTFPIILIVKDSDVEISDKLCHVRGEVLKEYNPELVRGRWTFFLKNDYDVQKEIIVEDVEQDNSELLEYLVKNLKHVGWPIDAVAIGVNAYEDFTVHSEMPDRLSENCWTNAEGRSLSKKNWCLVGLEAPANMNWKQCPVTKEQYFKAVAARQAVNAYGPQHIWYGTGDFPPVNHKCEVLFCDADEPQWCSFTLLFKGTHHIIALVDGKEVHYTTEELDPNKLKFRSESISSL